MSGSPVFLQSFKSLTPRFCLPQEEVLAWLAEAHAQSELTLNKSLSADSPEIRNLKKRVRRFGCSTDRVQFRGSCLEDFARDDWDRMRIFTLRTHSSGRSAKERSQFYSEIVNPVFERFYAEEETAPALLLHVTCTGYVSPSGAQRLVSSKNWGECTEVLHVYHMGCYAALPAIRIAGSFVRSGKASVDLVHTELCSLHLDPAQHDVEQLVMQTLFADGMIRYSVTPKEPKQGGFEILGTREEVIPNTENEMTWMSSDHGMRMTLSRAVPERISENLEKFLSKLGEPLGMSLSELKQNAIFAVHPGGPRIIDQVQDLLSLSSKQVAASNQVLGAYGNMSSATLPHIWQVILDDVSIPTNTPVVSLAFGPGLTISSALLMKRRGNA